MSDASQRMVIFTRPLSMRNVSREHGNLRKYIRGVMGGDIDLSRMKWLAAFALTLSVANAGPIEAGKRALNKRTTPYGIDVSSYQGDVDWSTVAANGIAFAFIKATEGTCEYAY